MTSLSFDGIFKTTNKGIPDTSNLASYSTLSSTFYIMSLILQIFICIIFVCFFGINLYRSIKKYRNPKFIKKQQPLKDQGSSDNTQKGQQQKNANDNLIYRFDEQDHEKQQIEGQTPDQNNKDQDKQSEQQQQQEEITQQQINFTQMENRVLTFQSYIIPTIVCNCIFAANIISIICVVAATILYVIFNVKQIGHSIKILSLLYMIPSIIGFLPFFINDHDLST